MSASLSLFIMLIISEYLADISLHQTVVDIRNRHHIVCTKYLII